MPTLRSILLLTTGALFAALPRSSASQDDRSVSTQSTATYTVTFDATWSAATHPTDFPSNPHFSGLIGGTHNGSIGFWGAGQLASAGIESMSETGSKTALETEVNAAITGGTAEFVLSGGGIGTSPGVVEYTFSVTDTYPLVTLVSMLAPSPDWFVGVSGLNLFDGGTWSTSEVIPLVVYDAGTDDGPSYESPNDDAENPQNIAEITTAPFDVTNVVGTFTFTLQSILPVELSRFSAVADGFDVTLSWRTESEGDNVGFEVEHALLAGEGGEPATFEPVGFVPGRGTTSESQEYLFDVTVASGRHAFRLKQIDTDGTFNYSSLVEVVVRASDGTIDSDFYPNPIDQIGFLDIRSARTQHMDVALLDVLGRRVRVLLSGTVGSGETRTIVIDGAGLPGGIYFVRLSSRTAIATHVISIVH